MIDLIYIKQINLFQTNAAVVSNAAETMLRATTAANATMGKSDAGTTNEVCASVLGGVANTQNANNFQIAKEVWRGRVWSVVWEVYSLS